MQPEANAGPTPWIVQGDAVRSGEVSAYVSRGRDIREVRKLGADILVLAMPAPQAERLRAAFPGRIVVEKDQELQMFGSGGPRPTS